LAWFTHAEETETSKGESKGTQKAKARLFTNRAFGGGTGDRG
jgi:hypothetical protein